MNKLNDLLAVLPLPTTDEIKAQGLVPASSSSLATMLNCPRQFDGKYKGITVPKVPFKQSEAAVYGDQAHQSAEAWLKYGTKIPQTFLDDLPQLENKLRWVKSHAGFKVGGVEESLAYSPSGATLWRGRAIGVKSDVMLYPNPTTAIYIDWKTAGLTNWKGEIKHPKVDYVQVELTAAILFLKDPALQKVFVVIDFLRHNKRFVFAFTRSKQTYIQVAPSGTRTEREWSLPEQLSTYWMEQRNKKYPAKKSGLCGWCDVTSCEHWKPQPIK